MKSKKGVALILAVGILAVLAVIATSFALSMRIEYKAAMNYYNGVKARYLAEAAVQRAISELREHVKSSPFDDLEEDWSKKGYLDTISSTAESTIIDEQRKVNVSNANQTLLTNLFTELGVSSPSIVAAKVVSKQPYNDFRELISKATLTKEDFDKIKEKITVYSYKDENTNRSPVNINTCDAEILRAVLAGLSSDGVTISTTDAASVASAIIGARPITSWSQFDSIVPYDIIRNNCNPNRDKSGITTTEFCFNSGGFYTITGTGTVGGGLAGESKRTVSAVVKIYDIKNFTTKAQFASGSCEKTTWLDSCPTDRGPVKNSLKIGYWSDFDEEGYAELLEKAKSGHDIGQWGYGYGYGYYGGTPYQILPYHVSDVDGDGDNELYSNVTIDADLGNFSLQVYEIDDKRGGTMYSAGWVCFNPAPDNSRFPVGYVGPEVVVFLSPGGYFPDFMRPYYEYQQSSYGYGTLRKDVYEEVCGYKWVQPAGNWELQCHQELIPDAYGWQNVCENKWVVIKPAYWKTVCQQVWIPGGYGYGGHSEEQCHQEYVPNEYGWQNVCENKWVVITPGHWATVCGNVWVQPDGYWEWACEWVLVPRNYQQVMIKDAVTGVDVKKILYLRDDELTLINTAYGFEEVYYPPHLRMWPNSHAGPYQSWNEYIATTGKQPHEYMRECNYPNNRAKTYNLTVSDGEVSASVSYLNGGVSLDTADFTYFGLENIMGDLTLCGMEGAEPAWDDLRIIPDWGTYTSATYAPLGSTSVQWGTVAVTKDGIINIAVDTGYGRYYIDVDGSNPPSINAKSTYIRFGADFWSDLSSTPILEDVTITYLPRTEIKSYIFSPQ